MMRWAVVVPVLIFQALVTVGRSAADDHRGWQYLIDRLLADGTDRERVARAFGDPRMAPFTGLEFSPDQPRESRARYRQFLRPAGVTQARRCRTEYGRELLAAERRYAVSASVLTALLFVETGCGRNTGSSLVFHRLARLAMANEPDNLRRNLERYARSDGWLNPAVEAHLRARARYLEATFYPEVRATFTVAERIGVGPLDLRGSPSGAFGYPQFLPTSFLQYAVDGDGNGVVSLYHPADAAASAARYVAAHGWRPGMSPAQQRQVIWHYNHSDAYVDTVLALAARIDGKPGAAPVGKVKARAKPKKKAQRKSSR